MNSVINDIAQVALYLWQKGWAERNGGNIVVNLGEYDESFGFEGDSHDLALTLPALAGKCFYCKGTGKRMRDLAKDPMENGSVIRISADGKSYSIVSEKKVVPTSELPAHLLLHEYLAEKGSIYKATLHTHPTTLVALSHHGEFLNERHLSDTLLSMIPETLAFAPFGIGVVRYALPSSLELAKASLEKIRDYDVVLWEKHGTMAVGIDIMDAFDQTDVLEKAALIYQSARSMGYNPEGMSPACVAEFRSAFQIPANRSEREEQFRKQM